MKYYTGVGSRDTPDFVCKLMTITAKYLDSKGYKLRSGGARGADYSFEIGAESPDIYSVSKKHISISKKPSIIPDLEAYRQIASLCCLHYKRITNQHAKDLHTRNICQVIGHIPDQVIKSDFLLAYTDKGDYVGGTTTAIRCAERFDVPVFNFGKYKTEEEMKDNLKEFLKQHMR